MKCREQRNAERLGCALLIAVAVMLFLRYEPEIKAWAASWITQAQAANCKIVQSLNPFFIRASVQTGWRE
jgi:hypothetical protein